jgi:hypothetical protein
MYVYRYQINSTFLTLQYSSPHYLCCDWRNNYFCLPRTRHLTCFVSVLPNVIVECNIRSGSNLGPENGYPVQNSSWVSSVSPCKCRDNILKLGPGCFLPNPLQLIRLSPYHGCYTGLLLLHEKALKNELQINRFTAVIQAKGLRKCFWTADLLFIPQVIYDYGEPRWNDTDRGKQKNSEKTLSKCHVFRHKSHMDWPWQEPGPPRWKAGNCSPKPCHDLFSINCVTLSRWQDCPDSTKSWHYVT